MPTAPSTSSNIKQLLRESIVIIFSVLFALFVNEWRGTVNQEKHTQIILNNIIHELQDNERIAIQLTSYHEEVLQNLMDLSQQDSIEEKLFSGLYFQTNKVAPLGIMREGFNDIAWQVAKEEKLATHISFNHSEALYEVYNQQATVSKTVDKILQVIYDRAAHRKELTKENAVLLARFFHEVIAQEKRLLALYKKVWETLGPIETQTNSHPEN